MVRSKPKGPSATWRKRDDGKGFDVIVHRKVVNRKPFEYGWEAESACARINAGQPIGRALKMARLGGVS